MRLGRRRDGWEMGWGVVGYPLPSLPGGLVCVADPQRGTDTLSGTFLSVTVP